VKQRPTTIFLFRGVLCMYRVISEDRVLLSNLKQATIGWLHTKKPTEKLAQWVKNRTPRRRVMALGAESNPRMVWHGADVVGGSCA